MENKTKKTQNWYIIAPLIAVIVLLLGVGFVLIMHWVSPEIAPDNFAEANRNFGWLFLMWASPTGAIIGLWLAWWGRKLTQETHDRESLKISQEKFKAIIDMLKSNIEWERVGACISLADFAKAEPSMKKQCVRLLFAFINNPPLIDGEEKGKNLIERFPADKPLRSDIQEAIKSFSDIYEYYNDDILDGERVILHPYFWCNSGKDNLSLIKANLQGSLSRNADVCVANLREADFRGGNIFNPRFAGANLQNADFEGINIHGGGFQGANLRNANLRLMQFTQATDFWRANLEGADISDAYMVKVECLEVDQISSAKWGYDGEGQGGPPQLPNYLKENDKNKKLEKWLEKPHYGKKNH